MDDSHYCPMPGSIPRVAPKGRITIAGVKIVYHTSFRLTVSRWSAGSALCQALYLYASATQVNCVLASAVNPAQTETPQANFRTSEGKSARLDMDPRANPEAVEKANRVLGK